MATVCLALFVFLTVAKLTAWAVLHRTQPGP
jgi:hypothetical protein